MSKHTFTVEPKPLSKKNTPNAMCLKIFIDYRERKPSVRTNILFPLIEESQQ